VRRDGLTGTDCSTALLAELSRRKAKLPHLPGRYRRLLVFAPLLVGSVVVAGHSLAAATGPDRAGATGAAGRPCSGRRKPPATFKHVIWIVMENHSYGEIIGSSDAPYLNSLAHKCGVAANFSAESHPSLPNYIAMTSGSTQGISDDGGPSEHQLSVPSIFSQLGGSWRALDESMPSHCDLNDASEYAVRHNPAVYYTSIRARCARQDTPLAAQPNLSARFTFITPNLCHDMHDCSAGQGDSWLAGFVPKILRSREYRKQSTAVFITWDEGSGDNHIPTIVLSRYTRPHTVSSKPFSHYSLLRTSEALLGIRAKLGHAAAATDMRRAFHLR
jgi:phosphatidylinositol-3-phosphatase